MKNELHEKVFLFLEEFRKENPDFRYWLRERDRKPKGSDKTRFENGSWFQGRPDYAFVGLYTASGGSNMTRSFGLVFYPVGEEIRWHLEIVFNDEKDKEIIKFYHEAMSVLGGGFNEQNSTKYTKVYEPNDLLTASNFLDKEKPKIDKLIKELKLNALFIEEARFKKVFSRIQVKRSQFHEKVASDNNVEEGEKLNIPLNQILYGPPGTGKTYNTINKAIEIANPEFDLTQERSVVKAEFDRLTDIGHIVFTTFHQSMSYEDFVEGIKPETTSLKTVIYKIVSGIFKKLCIKAESELITYEGPKPASDFEKQISLLKTLLEESENDEIEIPMRRVNMTITDIDDTHIDFRKASGGTAHRFVINSLRKVYLGIETKREGLWNYYATLSDYLKNIKGSSDNSLKNEITSFTKNYVLIIDEINRGNVSQIFGELITLIESDKRQGSPEALELTLPYSKTKFGVPPNLHIIGTMNTADRSVEALDAALRRRFHFTEMPPDTNVIREKEVDKIGDFNTADILETINNRIKILLDRDHLIGHSYFLKIKDMEDLRRAFIDRIIPLLQEYFYGDYSKIALVLGKGFCDIDKTLSEHKFAPDLGGFSENYEEREIFALNKIDDNEAFIAALELMGIQKSSADV